MQLIEWTTPKIVICSEGKKIRAKHDVYRPEYVDENGNLIPEHNPVYTTSIFVRDDFTEEEMNETYIEEEIN